jgi:hypothetical protein
MMPYGIEVLATIKGVAPSIDQLPVTGNRIGDLWIVGPKRIPLGLDLGARCTSD